MKTLKRVKVKHVCVEFIPDKKDMIQDEIYISVEYKTAVHLCLCGCGNLSVTPFINYTDWKLIVTNKGLSVTPSILNNNCPNKAHYIITDGVANLI